MSRSDDTRDREGAGKKEERKVIDLAKERAKREAERQKREQAEREALRDRLEQDHE